MQWLVLGIFLSCLGGQASQGEAAPSRPADIRPEWAGWVGSYGDALWAVLILKKDSQTPSDPFKKLPYTNAGLLVDIRRSTNRFHMFSLRQKRNQIADEENLIRDVSDPARITGVKLLSFDF